MIAECRFFVIARVIAHSLKLAYAYTRCTQASTYVQGSWFLSIKFPSRWDASGATIYCACARARTVGINRERARGAGALMTRKYNIRGGNRDRPSQIRSQSRSARWNEAWVTRNQGAELGRRALKKIHACACVTGIIAARNEVWPPRGLIIWALHTREECGVVNTRLAHHRPAQAHVEINAKVKVWARSDDEKKN